MPGRDSDVERIWQAAQDHDPADRPAFVARACGSDETLRQEVESLLSRDAMAADFLEAPVLRVAAAWAAGPVLSVGARVGPYEIQGVIGAGGMGEVYRARDPRLQRDVALKVLPPPFALEPARISRFQREAQVLASLSHPHIGVIYGLEEAGGIRALALELVEGPTLADRIRHGPIALDEALFIARQIAEALEAAHSKGIVHRDLKPANIKVRPDGMVKVLDFGLAKMLDVPSSGAPAETAEVPPASTPGLVLGTPAYMAPEQVRALETDRRADVWAFGCVLFEMLTGRMAFGGETTGETFAEVLTSDPDWGRLPAATPESIRRLLRRCLQKDGHSRLHDMADVRIEIQDASRPLSADRPMERRGPRASGGLGWVALAALAALVVITVREWRGARAHPVAREMRFDIVTPPTTDPMSLAVSPDGSNVVFVATFEGRPRLWLRALDGGPARPLPGTDFAACPFWSPDGRSIGFFADLRLKRLDLDGGALQTLARIEVAFGGAWTREGTILFSSGPARPVFRVGDTGGEPVAVTRLRAGETGHRFPQSLPDGRHFLYYATGAPESAGVHVAQLDGSSAQRLLAADSAATYAPSGHLLFVRQGTLYAAGFDASTMTLGDGPFSVAERVVHSGGLGRAALSTSSTGLILFRHTATPVLQQFIWFDRKGREIGRLGEAGDPGPAHPSLSRGGDRVAVTRAEGGNPDVWLLDTRHGRAGRFTLDASTEIYPVWSPDGGRIVFASNRRGRGGLELYEKSTTTNYPGQLLTTPDGLTTVMPDDWSPDGEFIVFRALRRGKPSFDLLALPSRPPGPPLAVVETDFEERDAQFSPDGNWIAYHSDESGRFEVYVQPFLRPGARTPISAGGGTQVRWSRDGKELFYVASDDRLMAVPIRPSSDDRTLSAGAPVPLFGTRIIGGLPGQGNQRQQYVVSPDGQRFLVHSVVSEETSPITAILNWKAGP